MKQDPLLRASIALDVLSKATAIEQAGAEQKFKEQQLSLQDRRVKVDEEVFKLQKREETRMLEQQEKRVQLEGPLRDFLGSYDPTDMTQRTRLEQMRVEAMAVGGFKRDEVDSMFGTADRQNLDLANALAAMRMQSGIQEWETRTTPDGRQVIDTEATALKHGQLLADVAQAKSTWSPGGPEERIYNYLVNNNSAGVSTAEIVRNVNRNQVVASEYRGLIQSELFNPSQDFIDSFRRKGAAQPSGALPEGGAPLYFSPVIYDEDVFDTDPGALRARAAFMRMQQGEVPVFERDSRGDIVYDNLGVAKIKSWNPSPQTTKTQAEADEAVSKAKKARFESSPEVQDAALTKMQAEATSAEITAETAVRNAAAGALDEDGNPIPVAPATRRPPASDAGVAPADLVDGP